MHKPVSIICGALILTLSAFGMVEYNIGDNIYGKGISNPYMIPPFPKDGPTQFLVFHGALASNFSIAHARCLAVGGDLADIDSPELLFHLEQRIHEPAYISSWMGSTYDHCIAIYPGGAVAIPEFGCVGTIASVCEVPVFGSGTIHLDAFEQPIEAFNDIDKNFPGAIAHKPNNVTIPASLFRTGGFKTIDIGPTNAGRTKTVTIFGAIQTHSAMPCCQCCS